MNQLISILQPWMDETPFSLIILFLSTSAFLGYGLQIFLSKRMHAEFVRFGMTVYQKNLVGITQIGGSLALVVGINFPVIGLFGALGFVIMMIIAVLVRWSVKDSVIKSLPALILFSANVWLCLSYYYWITN